MWIKYISPNEINHGKINIINREPYNPDGYSYPNIGDKLIIKSVALSRTWGGFTLSEKALEKFSYLKGKNVHNIEENIKRDDDDLINVIKELGEEKASGDVYGIKMKIKVITFMFNPEIEEFQIIFNDGLENIIITNKIDKSKYLIEEDGKRKKLITKINNKK